MRAVTVSAALGTAAVAFSSPADASANSLVFTMLGNMERGDFSAAARMFSGSVSMTIDGQERTVEPATLIEMVSKCRFNSVEVYGEAELIAEWACDEHTSQAKNIRAEMAEAGPHLQAVDVQVFKVPAIPEVPPVTLYTPSRRSGMN